MSLDERIEALTQSVDLLASMHRATERNVVLMQKEHRENERRLVKIHEDIRDAIDRLATIAVTHDDRLDDHDGRIQRLEGGPG